MATLAIRVENGDVVKATTALDSMTVAGGKSEAATQRLTRRMALLEIEARNMDAQMSKASSTSARFAVEMEKQARAAAAMEQAIRKADSEVEKLGRTGTTSFSALRNAIGALGVGLIVRELSQLSDTYTNLHARLAGVTTDTANLNAVQAALFDTAQRTRTALESTTSLYVSLARSTKGLGLSQQDLVGITQTVTQAFKLSGASTAEADNAIRQLGQAFASGVLRGDEFNSMAENAPRLQQALADSLGVSIGQLRKMAEEGKLTSDVLARAFLGSAKSIGDEYAKLPGTIGGAMQQLRNEVLNTLGGSGALAGAAGGIVTALDAIRDAIGPVARLVNAFFGGWAIRSAEAAVGLEKLRQKTAEIQMGIGLAMRARGTPGADFLIENAAKVLHNAAEARAGLEAQRKATEEAATAIVEMGTVSDQAGPKVKGLVDPAGAKAYKKLMEELRDAVNDVARAEMDADIARTKSVADAMANTQQTLDESELLLAEIYKGAEAYKAQQDEIEILHKLQAEGLTLSDAQYEAEKKRLEQIQQITHAIDEQLKAQKDAEAEAKKAADEAEREQERRARQLQRSTANAIEQGITDVVNGKNPLLALADGFKRAMIHAISEALAERFLASKFAAMLGIGVEGAAKKQDQAGMKMIAAAKDMNDAADKMLRANGITIDDHPAGEGAQSASKVPGWVAQAVKATAFTVATAYAGYQTGQAVSNNSTSHSTAMNYARGGLAGAASGAATGFALGGPIGAAAGAVIGFVGGLIGANKAMKDAATAAKEMRAALKISMDAIRAEVGKDALAASIAQVEAQRETIRKQIEDAYSGGDKNSDTVRERNRQLAELNRLEDLRIQQLREEAAVMAQRTIEDYQARYDAATPGNEKAEAIAANNRKLDREIEDLIRSFGSEIDATEAATLAVAQQAIAAEKAAFVTEQNTKAINDLTTAVRFAPSGFKLSGYIQDYATASPMPTPKWAVPTNPFVPPQSPLSPPMLSQSATSAQSVVLHNPVFQFPNVTTGDEAAAAFLQKIDQTKNSTGGINMTRAQALEVMKAPMLLRS